ncbi:MAG: hypothetical protein RDV48_18550 [Candidatus Eremiobacteraeota bacterium]|nr:hypothetical protein [Candidatus Eremiobacteraeota bacterium]
MNIGGIGQGYNQSPQMQASMLRTMIDSSGSETLKKMAQDGASDEQLLKYVMENPAELQGKTGGTPWDDAAIGTGTTDGVNSTSTADQMGNAQATGSAAAASDQTEMSDDCSDCYDENDEIPKDEAMASGQMCGMSDVSGADKCKPYTQQCLGEAKAIKKVLETVAKADQDNPTIGGDINEVDNIIKDFSSKLKKGKKAADGSFSNPEDPQACQKECDDKIKKAVEIAGNNGIQIEVSEKRGQQLGIGGDQQGAQGAPAAGAADKGGAAKGAQTQQTQQAAQTGQTGEKPGAATAQQADQAGGGEEEQPKPFKIMTEPKEVDKELSLEDVKNNPQLAAALESSLDETIAQMDQKGETQDGAAVGQEQQPINLGATREGSPLAQELGNVGKPAGGDTGGASVFGAAPVAQQQAATQGLAGAAPGGVSSVGGAGGVGGGKAAVNTSGIEAKMKRAGLDTGKKFNVKAQVYEPGMDVKLQRDGDPSPVKVGKNMGDATMKVKPPPLAAIDQNGEIHRIGDIRATDGGKSGIFSAKIKEGAPVMNLPAAVNTVQGDVALPGTKTENKEETAKQAADVQKAV